MYLSAAATIGGSLDPGGIGAFSWVTPGGTGWLLTGRGSTTEGLLRLSGETCTRRMAPGTTRVSL